MDPIGYVGIGILVAVALGLFLLRRERKSKSLDKLGPRAADANFAQQREERR
jgi:hypothetical protein